MCFQKSCVSIVLVLVLSSRILCGGHESRSVLHFLSLCGMCFLSWPSSSGMNGWTVLTCLGLHRDKTAVRQLVSLEDVMGQPLAAGIPKSVELSPSSSTGEPGAAPPRKRLHERTSSDAADVIIDLESPGKASRRSSSLRNLGAQVMPDPASSTTRGCCLQSSQPFLVAAMLIA